MKEGIFLGLGGNMGDTRAIFSQAKQQMKEEGIQLIAESSFYQTAPFGPVKQDDFLNQVIQVATEKSPQELLSTCLAIEQALGRERLIKWGPRTLDIDILFYHQQQLETDVLHVPHPGIPERQFVLTPMAEIAPEFIHPGLHKTMKEMAETLPFDPKEIEKL